MVKLKFCANLTFLYTEYESVLRRYDEAKNIGLKGVELAFPYEIEIEDLVRKKEETGMDQILINAYPGDIEAGEFGLAGLPNREKDFLQSLKVTLDYADALKCKRIHFMCGKSPKLENSAKVLETIESNLRIVLPELKRRGIIGLIEPINNETVPDYVLSDFNAALSIVRSINDPNIRLQVDVFHLEKIHGNVLSRMKEYLPFTGHIQIAQVPSRNEPNTDGEIVFKSLFSLLEDEGYKGWIGLEYHPHNGTENGLKAFLNEFNCCF